MNHTCQLLGHEPTDKYLHFVSTGRDGYERHSYVLDPRYEEECIRPNCGFRKNPPILKKKPVPLLRKIKRLIIR